MSEWMKPSKAAEYSGISERTLRDWLKEGLRHARLKSGSILIKREWLDEYLSSFEVLENTVDDIFSDVCKEMDI